MPNSPDPHCGRPAGRAGDPRFVWHPHGADGRNVFVIFERSFELAEVSAAFAIHLFADTRYRLRVNGEFVGSGPARFVTSHPEYDSYELARHLKPGRNVISVEGNFYGASSFQTMPDGSPGFIAWGGGEGICLATPGDWRVALSRAWHPHAPLFSFAQGPVEICDTRLLDILEFLPPEVLPASECPWGELAPYSGREIRGEIQWPSRIDLAAALRPARRILAVMAHDPAYDHDKRNSRPKPFSAVATWIRSPRRQSVPLSYFWAELRLNGAVLAPDGVTLGGNRQEVLLDLREGWNLLTATFEVLTENWAFLLGFHAGNDLSFHGIPEAACEAPLATLADASGERPPVPQPGDTTLPEGWILQGGRPANLTPAREVAWDIPSPPACRDLAASRLPEMSPIVAEGATWCVRFDGEFLGHPVIDVEAPAGAILDVACDDWQSPEGTISLYQSNPFTDSVERFILKGGRQRVEVFAVRGGKFLQITLRAPHGPAPLSLEGVCVRSRQTIGVGSAAFQSESPALDWAFRAASTTLAVSTSSAYADCPWRERGMYIGDALVSMHLDLVLHRDTRTARRMLRQFAQAQREDGLLPAAAPAWLRYSFGDYTLLWILALRDFRAITGDLAIVEELWPSLEKIWASPAWTAGNDGLWEARPGEIFVDWGVLPSERIGPANAVLNILRCGALRASAELAAARGDHPAAARFRAEARAVEERLMAVLWREEEGRLAPSFGGTTTALHANILALHFALGPAPLRERIVGYLEPFLLNNLERGLAGGQFGGHLELYFLFFALPALAAHGRPDLSERLIDDHYGFLRQLGDDTLPECFCRVRQSVGSRCHSWSGAAAIYAARHVLGIRPAEPGDPNRLVFQPQTHRITSASGHIAHPHGWIEVRWRRLPDGSLESEFSAPDSVETLSRPGPAQVREWV